MPGCEVCVDVQIDLNQLTIEQPLLVLPVANFDIILGLLWMIGPQEIKWDLAQWIVTFPINGKSITLSVEQPESSATLTL